LILAKVGVEGSNPFARSNLLLLILMSVRAAAACAGWTAITTLLPLAWRDILSTT
jgi:hypothetical protein